MAQVYNTIGSFTVLLEKLNEYGIYHFKTLEDIRVFRNGYKKSLEDIRNRNVEAVLKSIIDLETECKNSIEELSEKRLERTNELQIERKQLQENWSIYSNPINFVEEIYFFFKKRKLELRLSDLENSFQELVDMPFIGLITKIEHLKSVIEDRKNNQEKCVDEFSEKETKKQELILSVFVENKSFFYGAEGEEKVSNSLSELPKSYTVINDFQLRFNRPIYDRRNDDRICSIQTDHVVVGPTGLYLIETKNWSQKSVENKDLFSPVKQLKRHAFAFFVFMNRAVSDGYIPAFNKNWGEIGISPKSLVVLMDHVPKKNFQFVKVLKLSELNKHILTERTIYNEEEIQGLVKYLTTLNSTGSQLEEF